MNKKKAHLSSMCSCYSKTGKMYFWGWFGTVLNMSHTEHM